MLSVSLYVSGMTLPRLVSTSIFAKLTWQWLLELLLAIGRWRVFQTRWHVYCERNQQKLLGCCLSPTRLRHEVRKQQRSMQRSFKLAVGWRSGRSGHF